jgi:hypothetical protein
MLSNRLHWYASLPREEDPVEFWFRWLQLRAKHYAQACAMHLAQGMPEQAERYALQFEILWNRSWLLLAHSEVVEL